MSAVKPALEKPAFEKAWTCCYLCRRWVGSGIHWQTVAEHFASPAALRKDCSD